jgi:hypothetical protein
MSIKNQIYINLQKYFQNTFQQNEKQSSAQHLAWEEENFRKTTEEMAQKGNRPYDDNYYGTR